MDELVKKEIKKLLNGEIVKLLILSIFSNI